MEGRFRALSSAMQAFAEATQDWDRLVGPIARTLAIDADDLETAQSLADNAALAIANARSYAEARFWLTLPNHSAETS